MSFLLLLVIIGLGLWLWLRQARPADADEAPAPIEAPGAADAAAADPTLRDVEAALPDGEDEEAAAAIVFLQGNPDVSITRLLQDLAAGWPAIERVDGGASGHVPARRELRAGDRSLTFELCQPMHGAPRLTRALEDNAVWPGAREALAGHGTTMIVVLRQPGNGTERAADLTRAVIAFLGQCPASRGVLWVAANHIVAPSAFVRPFQRGKDPSLAVHSWVACRAWRDEAGRTVGHTQGLAALGAVDFEAHDAAESPRELRERLLGLTHYSVFNCARILSGDTTGIDDRERIRLTRKPSQGFNRGWVFQMTYLRPPRSGHWD